MEQTKKHLKISSLIVLLFAALSLIQIIGALLWGDLNSAQLPAGASENTLKITKIFLLVLSVLMLLPQVYIGLKGLKIARQPKASKGHIIWAGILLVFSALGLIDPILAFFKNGSMYENITSVFGVLLEVSVLWEYITHARAIAKAAGEEQRG